MKLEGYIFKYCKSLGITCIKDVLFNENIFRVSVLFMNQPSNLYESNGIYFMFIDRRYNQERQYSDYIRLLTKYYICINHNNRHIATKRMIRTLLYGGSHGICQRKEWCEGQNVSS